jgi:hypothetical protein
MNEDVPMPTTVWRRKEIPNNEYCRIALTNEECKEEDEWYIDSGCSSHMTGDQDKFINLKRKGSSALKRKGGNVAFGDEMLFLVVCGTSRGSSWLRRNEFLKMTK